MSPSSYSDRAQRILPASKKRDPAHFQMALIGQGENMALAGSLEQIGSPLPCRLLGNLFVSGTLIQGGSEPLSCQRADSFHSQRAV